MQLIFSCLTIPYFIRGNMFVLTQTVAMRNMNKYRNRFINGEILLAAPISAASIAFFYSKHIIYACNTSFCYSLLSIKYVYRSQIYNNWSHNMGLLVLRQIYCHNSTFLIRILNFIHEFMLDRYLNTTLLVHSLKSYCIL